MKIETFRLKTQNILSALTEYQKKMELQLKAVQEDEYNRFDKWAEQQAEPEDGFDKELIWEINGDYYRWTYDFMFPRSLRYSFMVLLFLVLENQLTGLCDEIAKRRSLSVRLKDLKGDILERSKTYLHKIANVPTIDQSHWIKIEDLSKVRNCIVHALGKVELSVDRKRLAYLASEGWGISISDDSSPEPGVLVLTPEYCAHAVDDMDIFFRDLFDSAGFARVDFKMF